MNAAPYNMFDKNCTLLIKFIAVILLISHHLFWDRPGYGMDFFGITISQRIGLLSKICVGIFVFLSGLGLQLSASRLTPTMSDAIVRVLKLWSQYIFIVILSGVVGVFFFQTEFSENIPHNLVGLGKFVLTCTGFQYVIGYAGFNPSWWYVTLTFVLYLLFPLFHAALSKYTYRFVLFIMLAGFVDVVSSKYFTIPIIVNYFSPFVLGMYFAMDNNYLKVRSFMRKNMAVFISSQVALLVLMFYRTSFVYQNFFTNKLDFIISGCFVFSVYFYYSFLRKSGPLLTVFYRVGSLSGTIYLMHMFVTNYFLGDFVFSLKYPILIFFSSYVICVVISLGIEFVQARLGYHRISGYVCGFFLEKNKSIF